MDKNKRNICPVCGADAPDEGVGCGACGFKHAFLQNFGGKKSFEIWRAEIAEARKTRLKRLQKKFAAQNKFCLTEGGVALVVPSSDVLYCFRANGEVKIENNVKQYSASGHHEVLLLRNGTVRASGENNYGQCGVADFRNIAYALAAPNCTYAADMNGRLVFAGSPVDGEVKKWSSVVLLACGSYHLAGLMKDGSALIAGDMLDDEVKKKVSSWKNVVSVVAATDCTLALHANGKVSFAGRATDARREAELWENVVMLAADSVYAFGLTDEGKILIAGKCRNALLDMGRRDAANWENVVAISCSRSGIGALLADGSVRIAGNVRGIEVLQEKWNARRTDFLRSFAE